MQKEDIRLRQVIIHIMDSTMGMPVLSDQVIDFGSDFGDFLRAHIFRLLESDDMKKCFFDENILTLELLNGLCCFVTGSIDTGLRLFVDARKPNTWFVRKEQNYET